MKRYIDVRATALLLACLLALLLGACAAPQRAQAPVAQDVSAPVPTKEFNADYADALRLVREQRWVDAEKRLVAMTAKYPAFAGPWMNLGLVYLRLDRAADAERALATATGLHPDSAPAHNLLGVACRKQGRFDEARRDYERALALDPAYADAHLNLGVLLDLYMDKGTEALAHYERYRELRPDDAARIDPWIADLKRAGAQNPGRAG